MTTLATIENHAIQPGSPEEASQFMRLAVDRGATAGELKEMFDVYARIVADSRKVAFDRAMTKFQAECPPMPRGHRSNFDRIDKKGLSVPARYSDLADIGKTIAPVLKANGLSYEWCETELIEIAGQACYRAHLQIRHEAGYSERMSGPPIPMGEPVTRKDGKAVQSAPIHAASVITTAQRLCLRSAFGLWSIDPDEEDAAQAPEPEAITADQVAEIEKLLSEHAEAAGDGATDNLVDRMLSAVGVDTIAKIPVAKFKATRDRLAATVSDAKARKG